MTHPYDLLAEYVDGSLGLEDRARVEAHLDACSACRQEAALAAGAREVLAAVPEAEPPDGLGMAARREARRRGGRPLARRAAWAAGAAAMIVAAGAVALSVLGGPETVAPVADAPAEDAEPAAPPAGDTLERQSAAGADAGSLSPAPTFRTTDTDHDAESLQRLARGLRTNVRAALAEGFAPTPVAFYRGFDPDGLAEGAAGGLRCVTNAFAPDRSVVPFLIERSSFEGESAFVSAFLQGPSPQTAYDRLVMIVADRRTCSLRTLATQRL